MVHSGRIAGLSPRHAYSAAGLNPEAYAAAFQGQSGGILGLFNMFAGGAVERMAIFALGIMPYISASIIVQLMTVGRARARKPQERGRAGPQDHQPVHALRHRAARNAAGLRHRRRLESGQGIVADPGWFFRISTVLTLLGGTMFLMWLGEQITSRGIGNGISLIIFAGIAAGLPTAIARTLERGRTGALSTLLILSRSSCGDRRHRPDRLRRACPASPLDPVSEATGRQPHVPGHPLAPAAEAEYRRRYPAIFASSLLLLLPATAAGFSVTSTSGLGNDHHRIAAARSSGLHELYAA